MSALRDEQSMVQRLRNMLRAHWMTAALVLVMLGVWEWQVRAEHVSALFFPAPSRILLTLFRMIRHGDLVPHLTATLSRVGLGFGLGGGVGLLLGLFMGWSPRARDIFDPLVAAAHPIPKTAILPLVMLIFGIGETSKLVLVAVAAFFPMLINTVAGVCQISPIYFDVAQNYGAAPGKVVTRVILPGSLPLILTGARLALNTAFVITVVVEMMMAEKGVGAQIWLAWETLRTEELYAILLVIAVLGNGFNVLLRQIERRLLPWREGEL